MKPKANRATDLHASQPMDCCWTPAYALDPLLPYLPDYWHIWEPAAGGHHLVRALTTAGYAVLPSEIENGQNFFTFQMSAAWDAIVTNPPYSIKAEWLERCYHLGKPFALLVPVETIGTGRVQRLMEQHGAELLLLDKRVNFHMPNKGWNGSAQFPVLWFCWRVLPAPICYGRIIRRADEQLSLLEAA